MRSKNLVSFEPRKIFALLKTQKLCNANIFVRIHFKNKTKKGEIHFYHYLHSLQVLTVSVQKSGLLL
jgi:hypothetical protein